VGSFLTCTTGPWNLLRKLAHASGLVIIEAAFKILEKIEKYCFAMAHSTTASEVACTLGSTMETWSRPNRRTGTRSE